MKRVHWITMRCEYCGSEMIGEGEVAARSQLRAHERSCPVRKRLARRSDGAN